MDLETIPQIRLVTAICIHGFMVCKPSECMRKLDIHHILEDITEKVLHQSQNIVSLYKAHLNVQLSELQLSVSSWVLVTVASCNLEIFVEAGDHKDLLIKLR